MVYVRRVFDLATTEQVRKQANPYDIASTVVVFGKQKRARIPLEAIASNEANVHAGGFAYSIADDHRRKYIRRLANNSLRYLADSFDAALPSEAQYR